MSISEVIEISTAILVSSGVAGGIILGCSNWLGKIWANRLMEKEKTAHQKELEELKAELQKENSKNINELKNELEIFKNKQMKAFEDKISIYRMVSDTVTDLIGDLDEFTKENQKSLLDYPERYHRFNRNRMKAYGYIAVFAPQYVMDPLDNLFDHLLLVAKGSKQYEWVELRDLVFKLINEIRKDIGVDPNPIQYKGDL